MQDSHNKCGFYHYYLVGWVYKSRNHDWDFTEGTTVTTVMQTKKMQETGTKKMHVGQQLKFNFTDLTMVSGDRT